LPVAKVTFGEVGQVTQPGRYMVKFGWLTVTADDLAIWRQFPTATFTLTPLPKSEDGEEFRLGSFDIGSQP
jgi:hypothetical protein